MYEQFCENALAFVQTKEGETIALAAVGYLAAALTCRLGAAGRGLLVWFLSKLAARVGLTIKAGPVAQALLDGMPRSTRKDNLLVFGECEVGRVVKNLATGGAILRPRSKFARISGADVLHRLSWLDRWRVFRQYRRIMGAIRQSEDAWETRRLVVQAKTGDLFPLENRLATNVSNYTAGSTPSAHLGVAEAKPDNNRLW